jgi:hypothetical protein
MTERGKTSSGYNILENLEKFGKDKYLVSQLLAFHFKKYNWDGMYIPGVHGAAKAHYHNLALFNSITNQWEQWIEGEYFKKSKQENIHKINLKKGQSKCQNQSPFPKAK